MERNQIRLNLPVDLAIKRIRKEARGRRLYLFVEFEPRMAVPSEHYERVDARNCVRVTLPHLTDFLRKLERNIGTSCPAFLVQISVEDGYVWVG